MMGKRLLIIGGVLNSLFFLFHLFLGCQIHHLPRIAPPYRALMEALNAGGVIFILFFAYASLAHTRDILGTGLGRVVLLTVSLVYLSRAAEEFILIPFTPVIFGSCMVVGLLYVAVFVLTLRSGTPEAAARVAGHPHPAT